VLFRSGAFQSDNYFRNLPAGTYSLTIKDGHQCTKTISATISEPDLNVSSSPVTCAGSPNGTITINATAGRPPFTYSIDGMSFQTNNVFTGLAAGNYTAWIRDSINCQVSKPVTVAAPPREVCELGYPDNSNLPRSAVDFNESEVLRAFDPSFSTTCPGEGSSAASIKMWYNDEHAMALGVRRVIIKTSAGSAITDYPITPATTGPATVDHPLVGSTIATGEQAGNDVAAGGGRPMWPALFITDITNNPNSRAGDWQQGGEGIPPHRISGSWKAAVKTIDKTKNTPQVSVIPDPDPARNNWVMGPGGDPAPTGLRNEGYGTEVVWFINQLGLTPGHTYHLQFMVHDGDQNKTGGDVGQGCTTIHVPTNDKTDETSDNTTIKTNSGNELMGLGVYPNPFNNELQVRIETTSDEPINLKMFNLVGELLTERKSIPPLYTLSIENDLSTGVYLLEIQQGSNKRVARMIKK